MFLNHLPLQSAGGEGVVISAEIFAAIRNFFTDFLWEDKILIQQEVLNTDILNTVFIPPGLHVVFYDYNFLEGIRRFRGTILFAL